MQVLDFATPHSPKLHKNLHKRAPTQNRTLHKIVRFNYEGYVRQKETKTHTVD